MSDTAAANRVATNPQDSLQVSKEVDEAGPAHETSINPPSKRLIAVEASIRHVLHTMPAALVQFAAYITDILVVAQLWELGESDYASIGLGLLFLSIAPVIVAFVILAVKQFFKGNRRNGAVLALAGLLAPLNLHTLVLGIEYSVAKAVFETMQRDSPGLAALTDAESTMLEAEWRAHCVRDKADRRFAELTADSQNYETIWARTLREHKTEARMQTKLFDSKMQANKSRVKLKEINDKLRDVSDRLESAKRYSATRSQDHIRELEQKRDEEQHKRDEEERHLDKLEKDGVKLKRMLDRLANLKQKKVEALEERLLLEDDVRTAEEAVQGLTERVEQALETFRETEPEVFAQKTWSGQTHVLFMVSKAVQAGMESLQFAILASSVLITSGRAGEDSSLFASCLILAILSMTYGFLSPCLVLQGLGEESQTEGNVRSLTARAQFLNGRRVAVFSAIFINIAWAVVALSFCYGSEESLGAWSTILTAAHLLLMSLAFSGSIIAFLVGKFVFFLVSIIVLGIIVVPLLIAFMPLCWPVAWLTVFILQIIAPLLEMVLAAIVPCYSGGLFFQRLYDTAPPTFDDWMDRRNRMKRDAVRTIIQFSKNVGGLVVLCVTGLPRFLVLTVISVCPSLAGAATDLGRIFVPFEKRVVYVDRGLKHAKITLQPEARQRLDRVLFLFFPYFRRCFLLMVACIALVVGGDNFNSQNVVIVVVGAVLDFLSGLYLSWLFDYGDSGENSSSARFASGLATCLQGCAGCKCLSAGGGGGGAGGGKGGGRKADADAPEAVAGAVVFASAAEDKQAAEADKHASDDEGSDDMSVASKSKYAVLRKNVVFDEALDPRTLSKRPHWDDARQLSELQQACVEAAATAPLSTPEHPLSKSPPRPLPASPEKDTAKEETPGQLPGEVVDAEGTRGQTEVFPGIGALLTPILDILAMPANIELEGANGQNRARGASVSSIHTVQDDFLDALSRHTETVLGESSFLPPQPEDSNQVVMLKRLQLRVAELQARGLSKAQQEVVRDVVQKYVPHTDESNAEPEQKLLEALENYQALGLLGSAGKQVMPQLLHVTSLHHALLKSTWATVPTVFQKIAETCDFTQSYRADACDYFVSHSWQDDGPKKVAMLRQFLFAHTFLGRILVILPLLACILLPLGFALHSQSESFPPWLLTSFAMALLAVLLGWYWGSTLGLCAPSRAPWYYNSTTVWIDSLCIDQTTDAAKQAGVASFKDVLQRSGRMVALTSEGYLSRLWCVYELATFSRHKPKDKLLLLSLDWPSSTAMSPSIGLSHDEEKLLRNFRCREAKCFLPADRVLLLREIREDFGSEEAFDEYVNTVLPEVMSKGKRRYFKSFSRARNSALHLVFGG